MTSQPLTLRAKISYGIGDMGLALPGAMLGLLFAKFLTDTVGLAPSLVAAAIFIGRTWDWINDPIQGYITDRIRTPWGRRRPFLLFGAIPLGLSFLGLWWIPPIESPLWLTVYYAAVFFLYDTFVTVIFVPYVALTPEITSDYDDRTAVTSFRMFFSLTGSLLGTAIPLLLLGGASIPPEKSGQIFNIGSGVAMAAVIPLLVTFFGTTERAAPPTEEHLHLRDILQAMRINRPYLMAIVIYLTTISGFEILNVTMLYFLQYKLQMPGLADVIIPVMFTAALATIPIWLWVSRRLDKARSFAVALIFMSAVVMTFAAFDNATPAALLIGLAVLAGVGLAAGQTLPWSILPDTVEYGEYLSGNRNEGMYYSFMTLSRKIASSISLPIVLLLLDQSGYVPNVASQSAQALTTITFLFAGLPIILFGIAILTALRFPLSRARFNRIKSKLDKRQSKIAP